MTSTCVVCGRPTPDGYVCHADAQKLSEALRIAGGDAEDAWTVIARQARYGGGQRGSHDRPLPVDLAAAEQLAAAENTIGTWARHVAEQLPTLIGPACAKCTHRSCDAIRPMPPTLPGAARWLATRTDWLRTRPEAGEAFDELHDACTVLRRLVDRPGPDTRRLVGMCDCGRVLYARHGCDDAECRGCGLKWNVDRSQKILRDALDERLVTAAEAAHLAGFLDTDRTQQQIRKLVNKWSSRTELVAHGEIEGQVTFRFGDIAERLARAPRRTAQAAEMGA